MSIFKDIARGFSKSDSNPKDDIPEIKHPGNFNPDLGIGSPNSSPAAGAPAGGAGNARRDASHPAQTAHQAKPPVQAQAPLQAQVPRVQGSLGTNAQNGRAHEVRPTGQPTSAVQASAASHTSAYGASGSASSTSAHGASASVSSTRAHGTAASAGSANSASANAHPASARDDRSAAASQSAASQAAESQDRHQARSGRKGQQAAASKKRNASDKELQKLRRVDLLELLVDQIRDNDRLVADNEYLTDLSDRLKAKLDDKDAQIERLKRRLDMKDDEIRRLEERNRALAHAAGTLDVSELVAIEEHAIDRYLQQLKAQGDISAVNPATRASHGTHMR